MHACIARPYLGDADHTAAYEALAPGLTRWPRDVIFANAAAHGVDPRTAEWE